MVWTLGQAEFLLSLLFGKESKGALLEPPPPLLPPPGSPLPIPPTAKWTEMSNKTRWYKENRIVNVFSRIFPVPFSSREFAHLFFFFFFFECFYLKVVNGPHAYKFVNFAAVKCYVDGLTARTLVFRPGAKCVTGRNKFSCFCNSFLFFPPLTNCEVISIKVCLNNT